MHMVNRSKGAQRLLIILGCVLMILMIASELLSKQSNGLGPYQLIGLLIGGLLILLGIFSFDSIFSKLSFVILSIVMSIVLIEIMLGILYQFSVPVTFPEQLERDLELGRVTPPNTPGHDSRGWRNEKPLESADIVAIGDSQTWGVNARLDEMWTSVLSAETNYSVYNMSQGSYGAVQYAVLTERGLALSPKLIVVALYFGNDIADAYSMVYGDYNYKNLRHESFDMSAISSTIEEQVARYNGFTKIADPQTSTQSDASSLWMQFATGTYIGKSLDARGLLAGDTLTPDKRLDVSKKLADENPNLYAIYQAGDVITFLTPRYRLIALDVDSPIVQEGLRITENRLLAIQRLIDEAGIQVLIALIPTKELVYAPLFDKAELSDAYRRLIESETTIRTEIITYLKANDILYVDTLPSLQTSAQANQQIYPQSFDGHPQPEGYRVIGRSIADYIKREHLLN